MSEKQVFSSGGKYFGYAGDGAFVFRSWKDVWTAVTTVDHPIAEHAGRVMSARRFVQPGLFQKIRVSFDASPPNVETVYPRWFTWGVVIAFGPAFWAGVFFATL